MTLKNSRGWLNEDKALDILKDIEKGKIKIAKQNDVDEAGCGNLCYLTEDGKWTIVVFVDCGVWDYIDSITHGGKSIKVKMEKFYPKIDAYLPPLEVAQKIYGIEEVRRPRI